MACSAAEILSEKGKNRYKRSRQEPRREPISTALKQVFENACRIVHGLVIAIVPDVGFSVAATSVNPEGPQTVVVLFGAIRFEECNKEKRDSVCRHNTEGRLIVLDCSKDPRTDTSLFVQKGGLRTYIGRTICALSGFHICVLFVGVLSNTDAEKVAQQLSTVAQMLEHSVQITIQHRMADKELEVLKDFFANLPGTLAFECKFDAENGQEKIVRVKGCTEAVLGFSEKEFLESESLYDFLAPDSVEKWKKTTQECLKGLTPPVDHEFKMIHKNRSTVFVRRDKLSRKTYGGSLLVILHDINSEVRLRDMTKMRDVEKARTTNAKKMSSYLAHEVRNQLYPQQVTLEEMRSTLATSDGAAVTFTKDDWMPKIDMILSANATVSQILSSTLLFARWEAGEFPVTYDFFPLAWLYNAIELFVKVKGGSIDIVGKPNPSLYVYADKQILKQAAQNLISNADKFRDGSSFTAKFTFTRTSENEGMIEVVVTDNGRGMTKDDLARVMQPFSQIRKGDAVSGTGLGLVLTKQMVEAGHRGHLALFSAGPGKGTTATMRVTVPWTDQSPKSDRRDELDFVKYDKDADVDVLIVDDSRMIRRVTAQTSRKLGLSFAFACDGVQACKEMAGKKYGVVLMDNEMPVMNGAQATEQSRRNGYGGLIVMVSGNQFDAEAKTNMRMQGMSAFISKMGKPSARDLLLRYQRAKADYSH